MTKLRIGDRVRRLIDVYKPELGYKYGYIIKIYGRPRKRYGHNIVLGPYPELYDVSWDVTHNTHSTIEKGFLPHGLEGVKND